jgi:opacity protein-like surface antigen
MKYRLSLLLLAWTGLLQAGGIELKSLSTVKDGEETKRKYGPYVGFFYGQNDSQQGTLNVGGLPYALGDFNGGSSFGIEVGKSWKSKRWPLMTSLEFEGMYSNGELSGQATPEDLARMSGDGLASFKTDMNSVMFMMNGQLSLDLYRHRARLGKVVSGLRPYIGAGVGGGQLWFRNTTTVSKAQSLLPPTAVAPAALGTPVAIPGAPAAVIPASATVAPFAVDRFVSAWQWFGGVEYSWKDKYSFFAEYREFHLGDFEELTGYFNKGYNLGFRYRY